MNLGSCLSETRIPNLTRLLPLIFIHSTQFYCDHTPTEACAGGTSLYISNRYSFKPSKDLSSLCYKAKSMEVFIGSRNRYTIGCIYRNACLQLEEFNTTYLDSFT